DFDETIIDCNTDTYINRLAPNGCIVKEFSPENQIWTDYMQQVFEFLHKNGIRRDDYCHCFSTMKFVPGMIDLIRNLHNGMATKQFELIIISDANSFSIQEILKQNNLIQCFREIFTNPARFDQNGCLRIEYYHEQNECRLSPKNLCKGRILFDYIQRRTINDGIHYDHIHYVGDGSNDLCPSLRLSSNDFIHSRFGYKLYRLIQAKLQRFDNELKAQHFPFINGDDIWKIISNSNS
ncbi:pyridoxal phosphate phosphatase PHOSPHO2-like protein, partial [Euroglyphus maynei]